MCIYPGGPRCLSSQLIILQSDKLFQLTLDELDILVPVLSYKTYAAAVAPEGYEIAEVVSSSPSLLKFVNDVISKTPKAILQAWLMFRAMNDLANYVTSPILAPLQTVSLSGNRSGVCIDHVDNALRYLIGRFYVSATITSDKRNIAGKMMTDIRTQFIKRIDELDWMPQNVKSRSVKKVENMEQNIAYPSHPQSNLDLLDPSLSRHSTPASEVTDSYFANQLSFNARDLKFRFSKLGHPFRPR